MYGAQTKITDAMINNQFENDVEMYGAQTSQVRIMVDGSLRMM